MNTFVKKLNNDDRQTLKMYLYAISDERIRNLSKNFDKRNPHHYMYRQAYPKLFVIFTKLGIIDV